MEKITKPKPEEPKEEPKDIRFDSSGKKIVGVHRNREVDNAILAINDKLDQLIGILTSTLPTRLGTELRGAAGGGANLDRIVEILSKELPDRLEKDSDQNVFQKAEMLSMVISTSMQHLQDAFASSQESILKALDKLTNAQEETTRILKETSALLQKQVGRPTEHVTEPAISTTEATPADSEPSELPPRPQAEENKPESPPSTVVSEEPAPWEMPKLTQDDKQDKPASPFGTPGSQPSVSGTEEEPPKTEEEKPSSGGFGWPPPQPTSEPDETPSGTS
ncbi:hypothetical protein JXM67_05690 [candidate division WOR-3 bacterium]|nr:hypothetical protein [candidate division WOR-3 bacterium]